MFDPSDPTTRELLAREAYYRERSEEAAAAREHDVDEDTTFWCLSWEDLSDYAKRPYRTAVATVCDRLVKAAV